MKLRNLMAVLGLAGGGLLAGQAQALFVDSIEIDNLRFDESATPLCEDSSLGDGGVTCAGRGVGGEGAWVRPDGTREGELYVNLIAGDAATTEDCSNCEVSHTTNSGPSIAHHYLRFDSPDGSPLTANEEGYVWFQYETDVDGADFFLTFSLDGAKVGDTFQWSDVAATGLSLLPGELPLEPRLSGTLTQTFDYNDIRLDVFSNGGVPGDLTDPDRFYTDPTSWLGTVNVGDRAVGLDTNISNVPEPTTLALLSLGMVGIGWQRRRRARA